MNQDILSDERIEELAATTRNPNRRQVIGVLKRALAEQAESARSATRRSESGETFLGELDYREALLAMQALFDDEGKYRERFQDQTSTALELADAVLGRADDTGAKNG